MERLPFLQRRQRRRGIDRGKVADGVVGFGGGALGGVAKCGNADASGVKMAMCGWADEGSRTEIVRAPRTAANVKRFVVMGAPDLMVA